MKIDFSNSILHRTIKPHIASYKEHVAYRNTVQREMSDSFAKHSADLAHKAAMFALQRHLYKY